MKTAKTYLAAALFSLGSWLSPVNGTTLAQAQSQIVAQNDSSVIDLKVVVDRELMKRDRKWWEHIKEGVSETSKAFEREFDTRVEIDSLELGELDKVSDPHYLHTEAMAEHTAGEQDAVVFFTGKPANVINGVAAHNGNHVMIFRDEHFSLDNILTHELSHLLGAYDYKMDHPMFYNNTYMSYLYLPISEFWDPSTKAIIRKNLDREWEDPYKVGERLEKFVGEFKERDEEKAREFYLLASGMKMTKRGEHLSRWLLRNYPENIKLRMHAARLYFKGNKEREALKLYEEVNALLPRSDLSDKQRAEVLNAIAYTIVDRTERTVFRSLDPLKMAAEAWLLDENPAILDTLGWVNHKLGNYKHADEELSVAAEQAEGSVKVEILEHLVENRKKLGDITGVFDAYEKLIAAEPENGMHYLNAAKGLQKYQLELNDNQRERVLQIGLEGYTLFPSVDLAIPVKRAWMMNILRAAKDQEFFKTYGPVVDTILGQYGIQVRK